MSVPPAWCGPFVASGTLHYIAEVLVSPRIARKLAPRGITVADVREAFELTTLQRAAWDWHAERGWRLLVTGTTYAGRPLNGVLYLADAETGTWRLGTALWRY